MNLSMSIPARRETSARPGVAHRTAALLPASGPAAAAAAPAVLPVLAGGSVGALPVPIRARAVQAALQPGGPGRQGGGLRQGSGGPPLPGRGRGRPRPGQSARRPERSLRLRRQGAGPQPAGQLPPGPAGPAGVRRSRPPVRPRSRMCRHGGPEVIRPDGHSLTGDALYCQTEKGWVGPDRTPYFNRLRSRAMARCSNRTRHLPRRLPSSSWGCSPDCWQSIFSVDLVRRIST